MVVAPMEALADVGYTWQQWGGGWNGTDAVHFELPGASERARQLGSEQAPLFQNPVTDLLNWLDSLPWYLQVLLPTKATILRDPARYTRKYLESLLG
jgi:hypothetical protein